MYARHQELDAASATGFSAPIERWLDPATNRPAFTKRLVVLMGPVNMSSAEAFLLMMKQVPGCQLIGERSYGASGNPKPHQLANNVTVYLPSWRAMLPDGSMLETKGVQPDIEIVAAESELAQRDAVLQKAIEVLKQ